MARKSSIIALMALSIAGCSKQNPINYPEAPNDGTVDVYFGTEVNDPYRPHDYGTSSDSQEMAKYLLSYSPIHNIKNDGTPYPAILVTTADHDDRVVPAHSFKYAATLQASDTGDAPKLIRIESNAGHGAGKPIEKIIDEYTDIYSFIFRNMGLEPKCAQPDAR